MEGWSGGERGARRNKNRRLDEFAFKLENGLLKLVQTLEEKRELGEWTDHLMIKESGADVFE